MTRHQESNGTRHFIFNGHPHFILGKFGKWNLTITTRSIWGWYMGRCWNSSPSEIGFRKAWSISAGRLHFIVVYGKILEDSIR